tara:strand:- start:14746 stop:15495 length:750 start_codon:yes stop_codon:yes gene_type:complete
MKKIAVVTGGGSGIGQSAALELQKTGFNVYIVGRREEELLKTVKLSENSVVNIIPFPADITNSSEVNSLFQKIKNDFGRVDILFNNAGMGAPRVPIEDLKEEDWRKAVDVNLTGSFLCAQQAVRLMKEQNPMGGRIINNGSISAHAPRPDTIAYTATKHAITGLTKSLALDGRNFNITASQIDIGNADTAIGSRFKSGVPQANGEMMVEPVFESIDCGKAVAYIANLPKGTNILNLTIMASNMPFVGRG